MHKFNYIISIWKCEYKSRKYLLGIAYKLQHISQIYKLKQDFSLDYF